MLDRLKNWWQTQRANGNANWSLSPAKRRAYATWDDDKFLRSLVIRRRLLYVWVCLALLVIFLGAVLAAFASAASG